MKTKYWYSVWVYDLRKKDFVNVGGHLPTLASAKKYLDDLQRYNIPRHPFRDYQRFVFKRQPVITGDYEEVNL